MTNLARQPDEVIYPTPWDDPIEGLPLYNDGLRCLGTLSSGQKCEKVLFAIRWWTGWKSYPCPG
jgi:hypothetical protein